MSKVRLHCTRCDEPLPMRYGAALGFDVEWLLCKPCEPKAKRPKVTLHGAPDGQEMGRWT